MIKIPSEYKSGDRVIHKNKPATVKTVWTDVYVSRLGSNYELIEIQYDDKFYNRFLTGSIVAWIDCTKKSPK